MSANAEKIRQIIAPDNYKIYLDYEVSYAHVKESNYPKSKYKALSLNIMDSVRNSGDTQMIASVYATVQDWTLDAREWVNRLLDFCNAHPDVIKLLLGDSNTGTEVIMVVSDTTQEWVLDYNEFLFDIRDAYAEVEDFMVIDNDMLSAVDSMYKKVRYLYERG